MSSSLAPVLVSALLFAGCAADATGEPTAQTSEPINGGRAESGYPAVGKLPVLPIGFCTGTLIAQDWVLTAKHCGTVTQFITDPGSVSHAVDYSVQWYPSEQGVAHDIQLVHLAQPIRNIRPLSIYTGPLPSAGQSCIAVGYGADDSGSGGNKRSATVVVDSTGQIQGIASGISAHRGPADASPPGGLTNHGDSGGPLLCGDRIAGTDSIILADSSGAIVETVYTALTSWDPWSSSWVVNTIADDVNEPPISAITGGPNNLDLFVRGIDGQLYHKWSVPSWQPASGWEALGGYLTGTPEAVTWGGNRIDVFVRGGDSNPATDSRNSTMLWHTAWNGSQWAWDSAPLSTTPFIGHPSATSWASQRLAAFAVDVNGNADFVWWNGSVWRSGALSAVDADGAPVSFLGSLKAISTGANGAVNIFAVGANHALYQTSVVFDDYYGAEILGGWINLGGYVVGTPSVLYGAANLLDIFVKSSDGRVYHKWADGAQWYPSQSDWEPQYGSTITSPVATSYRLGEISVIAPGTDGFDYKTWIDSAWYPSQASWYSLGSTPVSSPTLVPLPSSQMIDRFSIDATFTPYYMTLTATDASGSYTRSPVSSLVGVASPW